MKNISDYKSKITNLSENEKRLRDIYLKKISVGNFYGPTTGYASIDKGWLKYYNEKYFGKKASNDNAFDFFKQMTSSFPHATILSYYGKKYTRKDIIHEVEKIIKYLSDMDLKPGDVVSLMMLDVPESVFLWYALSKMGITTNMIKFDESGERINKMLKTTNSKYMFVSNVPFIMDNVISAIDLYKEIDKVIIIDPTYSLSTGSKMLMAYKDAKRQAFIKNEISAGKDENLIIEEFKNNVKLSELLDKRLKEITLLDNHYISYETWINSHKNSKKMNVIQGGKDNISAIVFTGGTTGKPKGVELSNYNLNSMVIAFEGGEYGFKLGKKSINILPPAIAYFFNAIHGNICLGVNVNLISHFTIEEYPYLIDEYKPNIFMAGPILFEQMKKANVITDGTFIESPISGGDKLFAEEELSDNEYLKRIGSDAYIYQGYGMSECCAAATYSKPNSYIAGSVGIPFININMGIFDYDTGEELQNGEIGEICISGPTLMKEYMNNPEETAKLIRKHDDGSYWLHTDDLGYMDNDGHVFHKGRAKRMLTRSGAKVWLSDIEDLVSLDESVSKCSCVKMSDSIEREVPVMHIVLKENENNYHEIVDRLSQKIRENLNNNYIPKYYVFRSSLPYSEVNKKVDIKELEKENILDENNFYIDTNVIVKKSAKILNK